MAAKKKNKKISIKQRRRKRIIKWTSIIILAATAITLFLLSDLFNIKEVKVTNNNKVSKEEIISLSQIHTNENMFKFLKLKAIERIKSNSYIEEVKIHRKINGTVEIIVKERVATYMLKLEEENVAYINNQGYILDITTEKIEKPIIIGYITENIEKGERLDIKDLKKLDSVIKIMNTAKERQIAEKITTINIENDQDYLFEMGNDGKLIHFGDAKNINDKFVKLMAVLEDTEGQAGEIFLQNIDKIYFRKEV